MNRIRVAGASRDLFVALSVVGLMSIWIAQGPSSVLFAQAANETPGGTPLPADVSLGVTTTTPSFLRMVLGGGFVQLIAAGDINDDGVDDLVVARGFLFPDTGTIVRTLFGRPLGLPQEAATPWELPATPQPNAIRLGDFNEDRRADLLLSAGGTVTYLRGLGDGTFVPERTLESGRSGEIRQITTGDLNGDGHLDVVLPLPDRIVIIHGNGDGTFGAPSEIAVTPVDGFQLVDVEDVDVNRDGRRDLVAYDGSLLVYLQGAAGGFALAQRLSLPDNFLDDLEAGDFNGDGFGDVVAGGELPSQPLIFYGSTDGLSVPLSAPDKGAVDGLWYVAAADFDADGRTDFFAGGTHGYVAYWSGADPLDTHGAGVRGGGPGLTGLVTGDFNGDGLPDLAAPGGTDRGLFIHLSGEPDTVPPVVSVPANFEADAGSEVAFIATAHDAIFGDLPVSCDQPNPFVAELGPTDITCSADDLSGNVGFATFTVTGVVPNTPPTFTAPADITVEATGSGGAPVTLAFSGNDAEQGQLPASCTPGSGTFPIATTSVTCTVTDNKGASASGTFDVIVRDTTAPALTLPAPAPKLATSIAGAAVIFSVAASDLVDGARPVACTLNGSPVVSGATFPIGTSTVQCSTSDTRGNSKNGLFTVTVTAPTVAALIAQVQALSLPNGTENSLLAKLRAGSLGAFQNEVAAQSGKKIPAAAAQQLIDLAKLVAQLT